jgi:hypothetical protein
VKAEPYWEASSLLARGGQPLNDWPDPVVRCNDPDFSTIKKLDLALASLDPGFPLSHWQPALLFSALVKVNHWCGGIILIFFKYDSLR